MDISFSSLQCKRAQAPEIEDVIAIRKIRERRIEKIGIERKRLEDAKWRARYTLTIDDIKPYHIDPVTKKRFKLPNAPTSLDIANMLKFYGIGDKIHKCPECSMEGTIRDLLPHLNNIDRLPEVFCADESEYLGERTITLIADDLDKPAVVESVEVDKPVSEESVMTPSGRSFVGSGMIVQSHCRSHGWNFKQIGEWMAKEGY